MVNFKVYGVTNWTTNNQNNYAENQVERLIPDLFLFFRKALYKVKASDQHLILIYFRPQLGHTIKTNFITFKLLIKRYAQF